MLAALAVSSTGCGGLHYDRISLGMRPGQYEPILPAGSVRRLPGAAIYSSQEPDGSVEAIVVLTDDIRLVSAKFYARRIIHEARLDYEPQYQFRAALHPTLLNAGQAELNDVLRVVEMALGDLAGGPGQVQARDLVSAGLMRVMDVVPGLVDRDFPEGRRFLLGELAADGGAYECRRIEDGTIVLRYQVHHRSR